MIQLSAFSDEAASDLDGQIAALQRNHIYYTELRSVAGKNVKDFTLAQAKEIKLQLADNGIDVWSIGSPLGKVDIGVDFSAYLDEVKHVCELANVFHTDKIRMFSFFNAYDKRGLVIEYLSKMVETAKTFGVLLCHENEKEIYGDTAERVQDLMQNVQGMRFVYDPANYIQVGEKAEKTLGLFHEKTEYFHIKDVIAKTEELVPAGYGDGDILGLIQRIKDDKVLTLEPHLAIFEGYAAIDNTQMKNKFTFKNNGEAFDFAVNAVKGLLEKAGYSRQAKGYEKQ
jgi:sugar phosphate isomerase/epimerase